jgi:hypothetical protein
MLKDDEKSYLTGSFNKLAYVSFKGNPATGEMAYAGSSMNPVAALDTGVERTTTMKSGLDFNN